MVRPVFRCSKPRAAFAAACVVLLFRPSGGFAADAPGLRLGARVRITTRAAKPDAVVVLGSKGPEGLASTARRRSHERIVGELTAIGRSVVVVRASDEVLAVQRDAIKWMEMRERGVSRRRAALTGAAVGLAVAVAAVIAVPPGGLCFRLDGGYSRFCPHPILTRKEAAVGATALFVPLGGGLGALLAPDERWVGVNPTAPPAMRGAPGNGGIRVRFALRF